MPIDFYAWKAPPDLDPERAETLLKSWQDAGGDPATSPFEASNEVGWF
jgi:hypothetical protein